MKTSGKRSVELAFNTIVIAALALTVLIVGIYFFTSNFRELDKRLKEFPILTAEPTHDNPIEFIPSTITRGKQNKMTIGFYNNEISDIDENVKPSMKCEGISGVLAESSGLSIPVGSWKSYSVIVTVPKETASGIYSCTITISESEKSFFMEINWVP